MKSNARTRDAQRDILECIRNFIKSQCYPPTIAEICRICGFKSKGTAAVHLRALRDQRLLMWQPGCERTFVVTDRAWVALQVLEAFLDSRGTKAQRRRTRRYLMRNVLSRPEISSAIEELLTSRGFRPRDAATTLAAHIKGTTETLRFTRDGKFVKVRLPPSFPAIKLYWDLTNPRHAASLEQYALET